MTVSNDCGAGSTVRQHSGGPGAALVTRAKRRAAARRVWDAIQRGELPDDPRLASSDFYDLLSEDDGAGQ